MSTTINPTTTNPTTRHARYRAPVLPRVAALYPRVSSGRQGQDGKASLPTQQAAMQAWAQQHGYATSDAYTYVEKHSGEELYERPALTRLRADARRGLFAVVVCYSVERLARQSAYVQIVLDELERAGVALQFATEELEDTSLGRAILNLRSFAGEVENERRKDRIQRAMMARVQSGKPVVTDRPPYGYAWADVRDPHSGKLLRERCVENPETAAIVRRIFTMAADEGATLRGIAVTLTREAVPTPTHKPHGVWDPTTTRAILLNPVYWGEAEALKRRAVPVDKAVRHLYAGRTRDVPRPPEERVKLPPSVFPPLVSKEHAERAHTRMQQNKAFAPRNNHAPDAVLVRGLAVCAICGMRMRTFNSGPYLAGPQVRCISGTRTTAERTARCRTGGNSIMAHMLDRAVWAEMIRLFEQPGSLAAELEAARVVADEQHAEADAPARNLAGRISDAERRLTNLRKMAELVDSDDQRVALAAQITLLARDRDVWRAELEGRAAAVERLRSREEAILDFQQHIAAEHGGSMEAWAHQVMRELLLLLEARVEVWPLRAVQCGEAPDRAVLHVRLPLSGERRVALARLLRSEHVLTAVGADADADNQAAADTINCAEHVLTRSTIYKKPSSSA